MVLKLNLNVQFISSLMNLLKSLYLKKKTKERFEMDATDNDQPDFWRTDRRYGYEQIVP